jgi:hypothetical protein
MLLPVMLHTEFKGRKMTVLENLQDMRVARTRAFAHSRLSILRGAVVLLAMTMSIIGPASAASDDDDTRTLFTKFVTAQNAHDASAVEALLWDSPETLWFTRGVEVRGTKAIAETLGEYYAGTWHLEPDMSHFRSTIISDEVVQILVPIDFTRGLPGNPPQTNRFLISQTFVRGAAGWRVATIMPIANTQIK